MRVEAHEKPGYSLLLRFWASRMKLDNTFKTDRKFSAKLDG